MFWNNTASYPYESSRHLCRPGSIDYAGRQFAKRSIAVRWIGDTKKIETVEVGQTDSTLRLWRAAQAVRHAELRLTSQALNRNGLETRATAIIGWSVPSTLATLAFLLNPNTAWITQPAVAALLCFAAAAGLGCIALWPRTWSVVGYPPEDILNGIEASELEHQEQLAVDYGLGITENQRQLKALGILIRLAWIALALGPIIAGTVALFNADHLDW